MRPTLFKSPLKYPVYISAVQIAQLVGWRNERVIRLWRKHGIAQRINGCIVTTPAKLQELWPEQWEAILDRLEEGLLDMTIQRRKKSTE